MEQTNEAWNKYQQYFLNPAIQQNILQSNEEQFQEGFLRELFVNVLGYTLNPQPNYNLITEKKNETNGKKADGAILADEVRDDASERRVIGIIELKDHKTTDLAKIEAQAFGYMNTGFKGKKYEIFAYNGGLFKPDEVLDNIIISDEPLVEHTKWLSTYDFESEVDVNILGHIFENSLSEIEEVTQQIKEATLPSVDGKNTSKRKQDGVFYTPQYITKYIVENTVGRLCAEKKSELGIVDEEYFSDKKRQKETRKRLMEQLQQYREWLLQITICDPACGSGAFLNAALQFLMNEHRLIDEVEAKVTGASIVFQDVENSILENNLFGVDINEESVEIAQLALWLRIAKPHRKLNTLNQNIKCGNSLISDPAIAGEKAFDWQEQFPKVFEKGGFDVVIGNPPYGADVPKEQIANIVQRFGNWGISKALCDTYFVFYVKALDEIVKPYGLLGFITPNTWKLIDAAQQFRDKLCGQGERRCGKGIVFREPNSGKRMEQSLATQLD